jgi:predicted amidophosphoribosyltransferase
MHAKIKKLISYASTCRNCGSFQVEEGLFCRLCYINLITLHASGAVEFTIGGLRSWALFHWYPSASDSLSRLIISLKRGRNRGAWCAYAKVFVRAFLAAIELQGKQIIYVPAPPRFIGQYDHSFWWAKALQAELGGTLWQGLKRTSKLSQRDSDRAKRALLELSTIENYTRPQVQGPDVVWIFVDDIVTTGATARAVFDTLGRPKNFMIWVLARRMLTCDQKGDLL